MRMFPAVVLALVLLSGCSQGEDHAQTGLPTAQITIDTASGSAQFDVELAATEESRRKGLMFRETLGDNEGMLFDFGDESYRQFWMKNTPLPLDMIFIKADGTISTIAENTIPYSETPVPSSEPVRAVLEIKGGRARQLGIAPGSIVHAKLFGN